MAERKVNEPEEINFVADAKDGAKDDHVVEEPRNIDGEEEKALHKLHYQHEDNVNTENIIESRQDEDEIVKKKYGGLLAKKHPLISKDHERAFFDSADWALNKQQGLQKSKSPLEALRPKLEPSPHQHFRARSAYAHPDDLEDDESNAETLSEGQSRKLDSSEVKDNATANHS